VVLLFNECDQLFGRKVQVEKSTDMFSNAVQSQLLNEMENLNGILIATCNSTDNLEEAFKRRFLFHMEFEKPDFETRKKIWRGSDGVWTNNTKILDSISQYELTGAQIDNVLKKMSLLSTIDNSIQDQLLYDLIEEEDNNLVGNRIGF
jgi:SpoVK/Ycf46/Vps4 family AAA+-type ATPase